MPEQFEGMLAEAGIDKLCPYRQLRTDEGEANYAPYKLQEDKMPLGIGHGLWMLSRTANTTSYWLPEGAIHHFFISPQDTYNRVTIREIERLCPHGTTTFSPPKPLIYLGYLREKA